MGWGIILAISGVLAYYDLRYRRLPNAWVLAGGIVIMFVALLAKPGAITEMLIGAAIWSGLYLLIALSTAKESIGGGDIKLAVVCGAAIGLTHDSAPVLITCSAIIIASLPSVFFALLFPTQRNTIPHGPSMLASTWALTLLNTPIALSIP